MGHLKQSFYFIRKYEPFNKKTEPIEITCLRCRICLDFSPTAWTCAKCIGEDNDTPVLNRHNITGLIEKIAESETECVLCSRKMTVGGYRKNKYMTHLCGACYTLYYDKDLLSTPSAVYEKRVISYVKKVARLKKYRLRNKKLTKFDKRVILPNVGR